MYLIAATSVSLEMQYHVNTSLMPTTTVTQHNILVDKRQTIYELKLNKFYRDPKRPKLYKFYIDPESWDTSSLQLLKDIMMHQAANFWLNNHQISCEFILGMVTVKPLI